LVLAELLGGAFVFVPHHDRIALLSPFHDPVLVCLEASGEAISSSLLHKKPKVLERIPHVGSPDCAVTVHPVLAPNPHRHVRIRGVARWGPPKVIRGWATADSIFPISRTVGLPPLAWMIRS
jgi:hypothetical protein